MKKLVLLIFICLTAVLLGSNHFIFATANLHGKYTVYTSAMPSNEYKDGIVSSLISSAVHSERGASVRFCGSQDDIDAFLKKTNAAVVKKESVFGAEIIYAYSRRFSKDVQIDGKNVNLQIAKRGGEIIIGTPLILGSY